MHTDFGVGEKELRNVALAQVFAKAVVIGEVSIVHQGLVQADERMGPARMPDAPLGWVALVGNPHPGHLVLKLVILHHLLGIAHDLQNNEVAPVAENEGAFLPEAGVIGAVQLQRVLEDKLILDGARGQFAQGVLLGKAGKHRLRGPHEVPPHLRRLDLQPRHLLMVLEMIDDVALRHVELGQDELLLHIATGRWFQIGHLDQIMRAQGVSVDALLPWVEARHGDAPAFAVAAIVHLLRGGQEVTAGDRQVGGKPQHSAATLGRLWGAGPKVASVDQAAPRAQDLIRCPLGHGSRLQIHQQVAAPSQLVHRPQAQPLENACQLPRPCRV